MKAPEPVAVLARAVAEAAPPVAQRSPFWTGARLVGVALLLISVGLGAWALLKDYNSGRMYHAFTIAGEVALYIAVPAGVLGLILLGTDASFWTGARRIGVPLLLVSMGWAACLLLTYSGSDFNFGEPANVALWLAALTGIIALTLVGAGRPRTGKK